MDELSFQKLPQEFYLQDTVAVAKQLIGKLICREVDGQRLSAIICETEAYTGFSDKACHSYKGKSERTSIMFEQGGRAYVYLIYGMYSCFNITTREKDVPEAVLIRAAQPVEGIEKMMQLRRQKRTVKSLNEKNLLAGPGRLCSGMSITREDCGKLMTGDELYICEGITVPDAQIAATRRINIDYSEEARDFLYRFVDTKKPLSVGKMEGGRTIMEYPFYQQQKEHSCCMTGHRILPHMQDEREQLCSNLRRAIALLAGEGITHFYVGGALGFDTLAAMSVLEMKAYFPQIKLFLAVPYPGQSDSWSKRNISLYEQIKSHADRVDIICPEYTRDCMKKRNYYMVDHSSACIYYMTNSTRSGTGQTVKYALEQGCRMIDLLGAIPQPDSAVNIEESCWREEVHIREIKA